MHLMGCACLQDSLKLQMEQKAAVVQLLLDFRRQQAHMQAEQQRLFQGLAQVNLHLVKPYILDPEHSFYMLQGCLTASGY